MPDNEPSVEEKLKANSELLIRTIHEKLNIRLDYNAEGVEYVDGYIERIRLNRSPETFGTLSSVFGSYVGECIRHEFGGEWKMIDGEWGIAFDDHNAAFPITKARKQLHNGHSGGDSVYSLYTSIAAFFHEGIIGDQTES